MRAWDWVNLIRCEDSPTGYGVAQVGVRLVILSACCKSRMELKDSGAWLCLKCKKIKSYNTVPSEMDLYGVPNGASPVIEAWVHHWTGIPVNQLAVSVGF